jgi:hypothetical protein
MIAELKLNKYYSFVYKDTWNGKLATDFIITAVTDKDNANKFVDNSLFAEMFSDYGITLSNYLSMMTNVPEVYVCNQIVSRDPIQLSEDPILIPRLIIDVSKSEELIAVERYRATIDNTLKDRTNSFNRGTFQRELKAGVKDVIKNLPEFGSINVNVNLDTDDLLMTKSEYTIYEFDREKTFLENKAMLNAQLDAESRKKSVLDEEIAKMAGSQEELQNQIAEYEIAKQNYENSYKALVEMGKIWGFYNTNGEAVIDGTNNKVDMLRELLDNYILPYSDPDKYVTIPTNKETVIAIFRLLYLSSKNPKTSDDTLEINDLENILCDKSDGTPGVITKWLKGWGVGETPSDVSIMAHYPQIAPTTGLFNVASILNTEVVDKLIAIASTAKSENDLGE